MTTQKQYIDYGSTTESLSIPYKENYVFDGFYLDSDFKNPINSENKIDKDLNIYIKWIDTKKIPYKVIYKSENIDNDDYSVIDTITLYGALDELVIAPIKTYEGLEVLNSDVKGKILLDGSLILEVLYKRRTYSITYMINSSEYKKISNLKYDSKYTMIKNVMIDGYIFKNWYFDEEFNHVASINKIPNNDIVVYGNLEPITKGSEGLIYKLNDTNNCYNIEGYRGTETEIVIPNGYNCLPVVSIDCIFEDSNIIKIIIGKNIQKIKEDAFMKANNLETIMVEEDNSFYYSEDGVLYDKIKNSLKVYPLGKKDSSFIIPINILLLDRFCFNANPYLEYLVINDNLITINSEALRDCKNLKTILIGKNVSFISDTWINNCHKLESIMVNKENSLFMDKDGILFDKTGQVLIHFPSANDKTFLIIDDNVK